MLTDSSNLATLGISFIQMDSEKQTESIEISLTDVLFINLGINCLKVSSNYIDFSHDPLLLQYLPELYTLNFSVKSNFNLKCKEHHAFQCTMHWTETRQLTSHIAPFHSLRRLKTATFTQTVIKIYCKQTAERESNKSCRWLKGRNHSTSFMTFIALTTLIFTKTILLIRNIGSFDLRQIERKCPNAYLPFQVLRGVERVAKGHRQCLTTKVQTVTKQAIF